ncbi:MAG: hypothetical protein KGL26_02320 [Pseudomonadota bacterium]|nr:hypothetical protein [Pseudomonadota bacterium]
MQGPPQDGIEDGGTKHGSQPAACSAQDVDEYSARMLRDLERLAEAQHHEVLARLLHLAAVEARRLNALAQPKPP